MFSLQHRRTMLCPSQPNCSPEKLTAIAFLQLINRGIKIRSEKLIAIAFFQLINRELMGIAHPTLDWFDGQNPFYRGFNRWNFIF